MSGALFTRADVEATLEVSPWRLRETFTAEIDPESMAETAAQYARAAGEAAYAGELAGVASRAAEEAGRLDGAPLADGDDRRDATARGLGGDGAEPARVAGLLVRAMNRALDAADEVNALIDGAHGLDACLADHLAQAGRELADAPLPGSWDADPLVPGSGGALSRPALIRLRHLVAVTERARETAGEMSQAIAQYRHRLLEYAGELDRLEYDVTDGPLGLWTTAGMGEFAAAEVARQLESGPDPEALVRATRTLRAIGLRLYDPLTGAPRTGVRLDAGELAWLEGFYGALSPRDLAALGALAGGPLALDPARQAPLADALGRIADGVVMLTDPSVGGSPDRAPAAVRAYLAADDGAELPPRDTGGLGREHFEDFGRLMAAATHRPGAALAGELAAHRTVTALWGAHDAADAGPGARAGREAELREAFASMDPAARAAFWSAHRDALTDAGLLSAPPDAHHDRGATTPYDSQEPLVRDYALQGELEVGATVLDGFGLDDAVDLMRHYLDASGSPVAADVDGMFVDDNLREAVDTAIAERRDAWARQAVDAFRDSGGRPVAFPVRSGAQGVAFEHPNWFLALGHADLDVAGVVTVEPDADGRPRASLDYQVNVWDRYNWDAEKYVKMGWATFHHRDLARLHTTGLAQEFDVTGRSSVRRESLPLDPAGGS